MRPGGNGHVEHKKSSLAPGDVVASRYRVEHVLGIGAMGIVLAAVDVHDGTPVAIKHILPAHAGDPSLVRRFMRETHVASLLRSEHVVRILSTGTLGPVDERARGAGDGLCLPYMVMERFDGTDLESMLRQRGPLDPSEVADYAVQVCAALIDAHALGLVHRDIKPGNLFITRRVDGSALVKVLDFGVVKLAHPGVCLTADGALLGTLAYMAPEQIGHSAGVDGRADIWSLGVTLYRLVTGALPFSGATFADIVLRIARDAPRPMRALCPDVPPELDAVVLRCLEKRPDDRYSNAMDLATALKPFISGACPSSRRRASPAMTPTEAEAVTAWLTARAATSAGGSA